MVCKHNTTQLLQYKHKIGLKMEQKSALNENEKYSSCSAPSKAASPAYSKAMSTI